MRLHIENHEARQLAQQIADLTGETLTVAVITALRERLTRLQAAHQSAAGVEALLEIGRRCAANLRGPATSLDHAELLYDENGLPK